MEVTAAQQEHNSACFHGRRARSLRVGRTQIVSAQGGITLAGDASTGMPPISLF